VYTVVAANAARAAVSSKSAVISTRGARGILSASLRQSIYQTAREF
jgi:hypothetical protein